MLYQISLSFKPYAIFIPKMRKHDLPKSKEIVMGWLFFNLTIVLKK